MRFLRARGAGDAAEDIVQEVWLKISSGRAGPVAAPVPYLFRTADLLMIDRYRSQRQAEKRDREWSEAEGPGALDASDEPSAERRIAAVQEARRVFEELERLGPRVATAFRRHRCDHIPQRQVAQELGVSLSTIESDLRTAYRALAHLKERLDEV